MRRRRHVMFLAVAAWLLGMAILMIWPWEREPVYQGRSLTEWLGVFGGYEDSDPADEEREQATKAIHRIGTNAIPWLLKWVSKDLPSWRYKLDNAVSKLPGMGGDGFLVETLVLGKHRARVNGARRCFAILGPQARSAIPELARLMQEAPELADAHMFALSCLGKDALPPLVAVLTNRQLGIRYSAAYYLGRMAYLGTNASSAVWPLVQRLQDADARVAASAALALGQLTLEPEVVLPALTNALQAPDPHLQWAAAESLSHYGDRAAPALPALVMCLKIGTPRVILGATTALRKIGLQPELVVQALTNRLGDANPMARCAAVWSLGQYGGQAHDVAPLLLPMLTDPNLSVRLEATNAMLIIAPEALRKTIP